MSSKTQHSLRLSSQNCTRECAVRLKNSLCHRGRLTSQSCSTFLFCRASGSPGISYQARLFVRQRLAASEPALRRLRCSHVCSPRTARERPPPSICAELTPTRKLWRTPCCEPCGGTAAEVDQLRSGRAALPIRKLHPAATQKEILQFDIHIVQICSTTREKKTLNTNA